MKRSTTSLFLLAVLSWVCRAGADDGQLTGLDEDTIPESSRPATSTSEWHFVAGGVAAAVPRYEGASGRRGVAFPLFEASRGGFFAGDLRGIGYQFVKERGVQFGARLSGAPGRKESADAHLSGTGDLARTGEFGVFLNVRDEPGYVSLKAAGGKRGSHAELGAGMDFRPAAQDILRIGASVGWANAEYMQAYFGIDATQASGSGLAAYQAAGGLHQYGMLASWTHFFERRWLASIAVTQRRLGGSARNSPLVLDDKAGAASIAVIHSF